MLQCIVFQWCCLFTYAGCLGIIEIVDEPTNSKEPTSSNEPGNSDAPGPPPAASTPTKKRNGFGWKGILLGFYILAMGMLSIYALFVVWPAGPDTPIELPDVTIFGISIWQWSTDARYGAIVALAGAVGSYVHLGSSFVRHAGVGDLDFSWTWWYIHRPWIGMALALLFYFLLRGGLLTAASGGDLNIYGLAGIGGLVG